MRYEIRDKKIQKLLNNTHQYIYLASKLKASNYAYYVVQTFTIIINYY